MRITWVFDKCSRPEHGTAEAYWRKKERRLQQILSRYSDDLASCRLALHHHNGISQKAWYELRAVLSLPTGTIAADDTAGHINWVIDHVTDKLVRQVTNHVARLQRSRQIRRKRHLRKELAEEFPMLKRDANLEPPEAFFALITPLLRPLTAYARRELRVLVQKGKRRARELTPTDLVDDVVALAWDRFSDHSPDESLDLWLLKLLHEHVEQIKEHRTDVSLEDEVGTQSIDRLDDESQQWQEHIFDHGEPLLLEDVLPSDTARDPSREMDLEEQRGYLHYQLAQLPSQRRRTFELFALHEYSADEIASLQNRTEADVRDDIQATREHLRVKLSHSDWCDSGPVLNTNHLSLGDYHASSTLFCSTYHLHDNRVCGAGWCTGNTRRKAAVRRENGQGGK